MKLFLPQEVSFIFFSNKDFFYRIFNLTSINDKFVRASTKKGILPQILESLLNARNNAKKLMAEETDQLKKMVYNGRQLALKVQ